MGDSYFGGSSLGKEGTWVNMLGEKYGMNYINYGIGGSTMSDYVTDKNPMVRRYTSMKKGAADIILLEGGRNDRTKEVPIGDFESRDSKTFMGSINITEQLIKLSNMIILCCGYHILNTFGFQFFVYFIYGIYH
jgi:hypothetical protein